MSAPGEAAAGLGATGEGHPAPPPAACGASLPIIFFGELLGWMMCPEPVTVRLRYRCAAGTHEGERTTCDRHAPQTGVLYGCRNCLEAGNGEVELVPITLPDSAGVAL